MPTSYAICTVTSFPDETRVSVPCQIRFEGFEESGDTWFELSQEAYHLGFDKYRAYHDVVVKEFGKVWGREFHQFLKPFKFAFYLNRQAGLLLICAPKNVAASFIKTVAQQRRDFVVAPVPVDCDSIRKNPRGVVSGAWFALRSQFLRSAGYFGPHVDRSPEFVRSAQEGDVRSLHLRYVHSGHDHLIAITRSGTVVLYGKYADPTDEIDMVMDVYLRLILVAAPG